MSGSASASGSGSASFINKSVNFSQTTLLKTQYLSNYLNKVNDYINKSKKTNLPSTYYTIIPNNGIKYFLYVTQKKTIEPNTSENYNILYFFPDDNNKPFCSKRETNSYSDFYVETDNLFESEYLFEGYLYKKDSSYNRYSFLLTDILVQQGQVIEFDYNFRFTIINEIIYNIKGNLNNINDHLSIGIHPTFSSENENMVKIFLDNFIFNNSITCIEHIRQSFDKQRYIKQSDETIETNIQNKKITKGKYPDVYNVYNETTNNYEGILYIKGVKESKAIKILFNKSTECTIYLKCNYNKSFSKWQPAE